MPCSHTHVVLSVPTTQHTVSMHHYHTTTHNTQRSLCRSWGGYCCCYCCCCVPPFLLLDLAEERAAAAEEEESIPFVPDPPNTEVGKEKAEASHLCPSKTFPSSTHPPLHPHTRTQGELEYLEGKQDLLGNVRRSSWKVFVSVMSSKEGCWATVSHSRGGAIIY